MLLSLTGFLLTGWFLSRAFVLTLFLLGGMVEAVYEMALAQRAGSSALALEAGFAESGHAGDMPGADDVRRGQAS